MLHLRSIFVASALALVSASDSRTCLTWLGPASDFKLEDSAYTCRVGSTPYMKKVLFEDSPFFLTCHDPNERGHYELYQGKVGNMLKGFPDRIDSESIVMVPSKGCKELFIVANQTEALKRVSDFGSDKGRKPLVAASLEASLSPCLAPLPITVTYPDSRKVGTNFEQVVKWETNGNGNEIRFYPDFYELDTTITEDFVPVMRIEFPDWKADVPVVINLKMQLCGDMWALRPV